METLFGGLFEYPSEKELESYLSTIDTKDSIKIIETALEFGQKNDIYTMQEVYIIYKSLLILKNNINEKTTIPDNDNNRSVDN